jgi:[acyl-carrier-protein] S-malonyltransferase
LLLKPAGDQLKKELDEIIISELKIPLVNNVMATYSKDASETYEMLVRQVSSPVRWEASIRRLIADGVDTFIEVGPGKSLNKFIKRIDKTVVKLNVEDIESLKKTLEALEVHI